MSSYQNVVCDGVIVNLDAKTHLKNYSYEGDFIPICVSDATTSGNFVKAPLLDLSDASLGLYFAAGFTIVGVLWASAKGISIVVNFLKSV